MKPSLLTDVSEAGVRLVYSLQSLSSNMQLACGYRTVSGPWARGRGTKALVA